MQQTSELKSSLFCLRFISTSKLVSFLLPHIETAVWRYTATTLIFYVDIIRFTMHNATTIWSTANSAVHTN